MSRLSKLRPSPALAIALIALFIALGGTSYGLATGVIDGREIQNRSITGKDIKPRSLQGTLMRLSSVGGNAVKESSLGPVPAADGLTHAAVVNPAGVLVRGRNVVSAARTAVGRYQVVFDRDVSGCFYAATIGDEGTGSPGSGSASVAGLSTSANGVAVRTVRYNSAGNPVNQDKSFHLLVSC